MYKYKKHLCILDPFSNVTIVIVSQEQYLEICVCQVNFIYTKSQITIRLTGLYNLPIIRHCLSSDPRFGKTLSKKSLTGKIYLKTKTGFNKQF